MESQLQSACTPLMHVILKAVEEDGRRIVYLEASTEDKDMEDETLLSTALIKAKDYFLEHGVISWDHKHKQLNDPEFIIGEPLDVRFNNGSTLVKAWLYPNNRHATSVWQMIKAKTTRLGSSVGGYVLNKGQENDISQVLWDEVAITYKPVNQTTQGQVQLMPFEEFAKALTAGAGVDAAQFTGGRALTPESLQGATVRISPPEIQQILEAVLRAVSEGAIQSEADLDQFLRQRGPGSRPLIKDFVLARLPALRD